jgi:hypothetical protein
VTLAELTPVVSAEWVPAVKADQQRVQVPVSGTGAPPSGPDTMSRIHYTVTYTRRPVYTLTGRLSIAAAAFSSGGYSGSSTGADAGGSSATTTTTTYLLQLPVISLSQGPAAGSSGSGGGSSAQQPAAAAAAAEAIPAERVACSSLSLAAPGGSVTCTFSARVFALLAPPAGGVVQAAVRVVSGGGLQQGAPAVIHTPPAAFAWPAPDGGGSGAAARHGGGGAASVQLLQDTMQARGGGGASGGGGAAAATVTNYFEPGEGHVLPVGVQGTQPPANSRVSGSSAAFSYTALLADIPREQCGKALKARFLCVCSAGAVLGAAPGVS